MAVKRKSMYRLNTRVTHEQNLFVKAEAKRLKLSEAEVYRLMVDYYKANKQSNDTL